MSEVAVYLISLPVAVYLLANLYALRDEHEKAVPLVRLAASLCAVLIILLVIGRGYLYPMLYAVLTIAIVYVAAFYLARGFALGVDSHADTPPDFNKAVHNSTDDLENMVVDKEPRRQGMGEGGEP